MTDQSTIIKIKGHGNITLLHYANAKTNQLVEFGYGTLTEQEVVECVIRLWDGKAPENVIEHFIIDDLILPE